MARPIKKGLEYFPLDVDFLSDIKIRRIIRACGKESVHILIALLANIFRGEGYYIVWDDDLAFLVADEVGTKEGTVDELVQKALQVNFFNKAMFDNYKVLTSRGIQDRYIIATKERKEVVLESNYLLSSNVDRANVLVNRQDNSNNQPNNLVNPSNNSINLPINTQSKEKESKVKKSNKDKVRACKYSDEHLRLATKLRDNLRDDFPNQMKRANVEKWADTFRLMQEKDSVTPEQVEYVIDWLGTGVFWTKNILSADKLREKFEVLKQTIKEEKEHSRSLKSKQKKNTRQETLPDWAKDNHEANQAEAVPMSKERQQYLADMLKEIEDSEGGSL